MKKSSVLVLTMLLLMIGSAYASIPTMKSANSVIQQMGPEIIVEPSSVDVPVGSNFTVSVMIANISNFYGLDLQFTWDPAIIKYVSHVKEIPVETHPDGILHSPTINVRDQVDENATMPGSENGTRYWLAEASMLPAEAFNGTGIAFTMTFMVAAVGPSPLSIVAATLADESGNPITYETTNGVFDNRAPPQAASVFVMPSSATIQKGNLFDISVVIANVTDLYGLDLQFTWDPAIIKYVSHVKTIPVEANPGGILHSGTIPVRDVVDENATIPDAVSGTRYWLAEASLAPAPSFNGSGTAFTMTFMAIAPGESDLLILSATLSDRLANPINYTRMDGHVSVQGVAQVASIRVVPSDQTVRVVPGVNDTFTISVMIENVTDLYGLDIQFTWDPTVIKYVSHVKTIPVDTNPDGILNGPTVNAKDIVDENATIPDAVNGTRYWLAEASEAPAASFNGSGTAFTMTFLGLKNGESGLTILSATLSDRLANPITYEKTDGHVTVEIVPELSVSGFILFALLTTAAASAIALRKTRLNKRIL